MAPHGSLEGVPEENLVPIKEGLAEILVPDYAVEASKQRTGAVRDGQNVFYNPIQQFNRDLTVLAIRAYGEDLIAGRQATAVKYMKIRDNNIANGRKWAYMPRGKKRKANALSNDQPEPVGASSDTGTAENEATQEGVDSETANSNGDSSEPKTNGSEGRIDPEYEASLWEEAKKAKGEFKILDALSATGIRAFRFAKEIPFTTSVTANDLSQSAVNSIKRNIEHNGLQDKVHVHTSNALTHMYSFVGVPASDSGGKYDVVDLDPYGSSGAFVSGALQALKTGGLLCATFTDAGVWASCGYPEKAFAQYGGTPIKGFHSHEGGLRLILQSIASAGAKFGLAIEPVLSLSIDFYARVFVRLTRSHLDTKMLAGKTMVVYSCDSGCGAWKTQYMARTQETTAKDGSMFHKFSLAQGPTGSPNCEHCGMKTHISGPMYGGPLHNPAFINSILEQLPSLDKEVYGTTDRIEGMLTNALEEVSFAEDPASFFQKGQVERPIPFADPAVIDKTPFFFNPSALAKVVHCVAPSEASVKGALKHAGYKVGRSHTKPGTIKTNAPWSFIWEMMREWVRQKAPIRASSIKNGTAGEAILRLRQSPSPSASDAKSASNGASEGGEGKKQEYGPHYPPYTVVFDEKLGAEKPAKKLVRYQLNPRENWGPMNRARG